MSKNSVFVPAYVMQLIVISIHFSSANIKSNINDRHSRLGGKFHPSIYRWNLPVCPGMANKAQVANTGKYNFLPQNTGKYEFEL